MKLKYIMNEILHCIKENSNTIVIYHGTEEKHDFTSTGNMESGTFFSEDKNTAKTFGKYVYKVTLKPDLKILDVTTDEGAQWVLDKFKKLYDTYYDEGEDEYEITDVDSIVNHSDSWEAIENTPNVVSRILGSGFDGYAATEGGDKTYLIFSPVKEKIQSAQLVK